MIKKISLLLCLSFWVVTSHAALLERLGGLAYYDDVLDITWTVDAQYPPRTMDWWEANIWVDSLEYAGISGWRLPSVDLNRDGVVIDCFFNTGECTDNEFSYMYWVNGVNTRDQSPFFNITDIIYWSGSSASGGIYVFNFHNGETQGTHPASSDGPYLWAVHDGDVGVVPIPAAAWLFGSGLFGLIGLARGGEV